MSERPECFRSSEIARTRTYVAGRYSRADDEYVSSNFYLFFLHPYRYQHFSGTVSPTDVLRIHVSGGPAIPCYSYIGNDVFARISHLPATKPQETKFRTAATPTLVCLRSPPEIVIKKNDIVPAVAVPLRLFAPSRLMRISPPSARARKDRQSARTFEKSRKNEFNMYPDVGTRAKKKKTPSKNEKPALKVVISSYSRAHA